MTIEISRLLKKGFTPLVANKFAAVSWQGETLGEFWMWNGQLMKGPEGRQYIQTVKVTDLGQASLRYWRDGWTPLKWDEPLLRRMEESLRRHGGLKAQGVAFPDGPFLKEPMAIPEDYLTPGISDSSRQGVGNERESCC